jgi:hypothetical protein
MESGRYNVHGPGKNFRAFQAEEILDGERRIGSATWRMAENGRIFAVRWGLKEHFSKRRDT